VNPLKVKNNLLPAFDYVFYYFARKKRFMATLLS